MIHLTRPEPPTVLSNPADEHSLGLEFKTHPTRQPWRRVEILKALHKSSNGKCAYCETSIGDEEPQGMEVDHYQNKDEWPLLAATWANLLPSCHTCNNYKGTYNVIDCPFVNPYIDDPRQHIAIRGGLLKWRTPQGAAIIERLHLNERLAGTYAQIWRAIDEMIESLLETLQDVDQGLTHLTPGKQGAIVKKARSILRSGTASKQYSAYVATRITRSIEWENVEALLRKHHLWEPQMQKLKLEQQSIVLPR